MGSYDGAEAADLVGIYLLSQLTKLNLNIGLYRDDGLAVCRLKPRQAELTRKKLCAIFKENGLSITSTANGKNVNFLDVNVNLEEDIYRPYMKPNDRPVYVHSQSNHPKSILENIPYSVNKRLSLISSNKDVFDHAVHPYQEALRNSGYNYQLNYDPDAAPHRKSRNRKRRITYFNPPFSLNVKTSIGKEFFKILDNNFPKDHPLYKIVNRNTVKLGYSCMPNLKQKINCHNQKICRGEAEQELAGCNCTQVIGECPLDGNCKVRGVIYRAEVSTENETFTYTGLTSRSFKDRFYGHRRTFKEKIPEESTTLSRKVWGLKEKNEDFSIKWSIVDRGTPFNPKTRRCNLCTKEKFYIIFDPDGASLNQRSELYSACRHRTQQLLSNLES